MKDFFALKYFKDSKSELILWSIIFSLIVGICLNQDIIIYNKLALILTLIHWLICSVVDKKVYFNFCALLINFFRLYFPYAFMLYLIS